MAKKNEKQVIIERESRKEILRKRKQDQQLRQIRIGVAAVVALVLLVVIVGLVVELVVAPNRTVAEISFVDATLGVTGERKISLREWQDRVVYERAQRIIFLETQLEAFGGDVGLIQQFAGQTILDLQDAELLGQNTLDLMVEEAIIREASEARGITVTDADVNEALGEAFGYYGGGLPTPMPTATQTAVPTPSLTPIPTPVITEVVPTAVPSPTPTTGPTSTPGPTATPVSEEAFQERLGEEIARLRDYNVKEETFREYVRTQLYRERLTEALAEEANLQTEAEQASIYVLTFATEADANEALAMIETEGYLTVWNTVRSTPVDSETAFFPGARALENIWRTQGDLASIYNEEIAVAAFSLPVGQASDVLVRSGAAEEQPDQYLIIQVSGREERELAQNTIDQLKAQLLDTYVRSQVAQGVQLYENWRSRVPSQPILDPIFLTQPTPAPAVTPVEE